MVALSPGLILAAYINWDLFAMALTACGLAAWAARRPWLAGALLGLAVATKFYPLMFFGALFLLCLRAGKLREFGKALAGGLIAWLVINLPVALTATSGWAEFYAFSRSRGADWGSVWYLFEHYNVPVVGNSSLGELNLISSGAFAVACVLIAVLALAAPRRPRLPQLCFLLLASFLILNKVWSPQYVIWLVPLAVLARPRMWAYVLWQLAEVAYFLGIWGYFVYMYQPPDAVPASAPAGTSSSSPRGCCRSPCSRPRWSWTSCSRQRDRVRASGVNDDPAGGVLDGAPDRLAVTLAPRHPLTRPRRLPASVLAVDIVAWSQAMSAARPGSGVSQTTGAPAARTTSSSACGSIVPESKLACRSAPEPNSSRELLQCTRSIRPVIAFTRSTASASSMPAEFAWQVSRQNPTSPFPAHWRRPPPR